jgi:hypothetical protein
MIATTHRRYKQPAPGDAGIPAAMVFRPVFGVAGHFSLNLVDNGCGRR